MKHCLLLLLAVPLLLAPVRYQQGSGDITLQPSTAPMGARGTVAVALPSPTVIEISPTRAPLISLTLPLLEEMPKATVPTKGGKTPATRAPQAQPNPQPTPRGMSPQQAAVCVRALTMLSDITSVSMKQSGRENLIDLSIATAVAQVQAAQGQWPNLEGLRSVPLFTPNRTELKQALTYSRDFCRNPNAPTQPVGSALPR